MGLVSQPHDHRLATSLGLASGLQGEHSNACSPAVGAQRQVHVIMVVLLCEFLVCKSEIQVRTQPGALCSTPAPSFANVSD